MGIYTPLIELTVGAAQLAVVQDYKADYEYVARYDKASNRQRNNMAAPSQGQREHARMFESIALAGAMGAMINTR